MWIWQAAAVTGLSWVLRGFSSTPFAFGSADGSWRAVVGGCLPNRALDVSTRLACLHGIPHWQVPPVQTWRYSTASVRTRTTRQTPWPRGGPRCCTQPHLGRAFQSIKYRLHYDMCHVVSWLGLFQTPHSRTSPPAQNVTQSQEANVSKGNSSLCWQFGL